MNLPLKHCTKGQHWQSRALFGRKARASDGLDWNCKPCNAQWWAAWSVPNRDRERRRHQAYKSTHKSQRNTHERQRYRTDDAYRVKKIANSKVQQAKRPANGIIRFQSWLAAQPQEFFRRCGYNSCKTRRMRLRSVLYTHIDLAVIAIRDYWRCHLCGQNVTRQTWSLDHLIPVSQGGPHVPSNVALAHRVCNSRRHTDRLPAKLRLNLIV